MFWLFSTLYALLKSILLFLSLQLTYDPLSGQSADPASFLPTLSFTNVRLRLLRFGSTGLPPSNSLLGPVIDRGSFYSIYDIAVDGACICNGEVVSPIDVRLAS